MAEPTWHTFPGTWNADPGNLTQMTWSTWTTRSSSVWARGVRVSQSWKLWVGMGRAKEVISEQRKVIWRGDLAMKQSDYAVPGETGERACITVLTQGSGPIHCLSVSGCLMPMKVPTVSFQFLPDWDKCEKVPVSYRRNTLALFII